MINLFEHPFLFNTYLLFMFFSYATIRECPFRKVHGFLEWFNILYLVEIFVILLYVFLEKSYTL